MVRFTLVGCLALLSACATTQFKPVETRSLPTAEQFPDDDAVILSHSETIEFQPGAAGPEAIIEARERVVILKPDGSGYANVFAYYDKEFHEVVSIDVLITRPDGTEKKLTAKDGVDQPSYAGYALYSDSRSIAVDVGVLPEGTVVDSRVVTKSKRAELFQLRYYMRSYLPLQKYTYRITAPAAWSIRHAERPTAVDPVESMSTDGRKVWTWSGTAPDPIRHEKQAPKMHLILPHVSVQLAAWTHDGATKEAPVTPEDYGRWMYALQAPNYAVPPGLDKTVSTILADVEGDDTAKAKKLYEWVQSNIRYVAIQLGIGGWRPHTAAEVLEQGYGDCKDKANLLRAMLKAAGIQSHLTTIYSHDGYPKEYELAAIGNANHAILAVELGDELVLADPTTRFTPFGHLPPNDQGAQVVVAKEDAGVFLTTAESSFADNLRDTRVQMKLQESGEGKGAVAIETRGAWAELLVAYTHEEGPKRLKKVAKGWSKLANAKIKKTPKPEGSKMTADVSVERWLAKAGTKRILRLSEAIRQYVPRLPAGERASPVVFRFRSTEKLTVELTPPKGWHFGKLPAAYENDTPLGKASLRWSEDGGAIVASMSLETKEKIIQPKDYDALRAFYDGFLSALERPLILSPKGDS